MSLTEKSENSNSIIQFLFYVVCHIPASIHVNLKVPILSAADSILFGQDSPRAKGETIGGKEDGRHERLATSQDGCRWHQRCGARPVKISFQARISATPAARKGSERDRRREERIVERGAYVRRSRGSLSLRGEGRIPGWKGRSFLSSWPRALIGGQGRLQPPCYHDYRRDNPAAADWGWLKREGETKRLLAVEGWWWHDDDANYAAGR